MDSTKTISVVNGKEYIGGMIASTGFLQQDCASIKYIFNNLDDNFLEISYESQDDFVIVKKDKKIKVQVKINQLTTQFVRKILGTLGMSQGDQNVIIGSGYDDDFRNVISERERYLNILAGKTFSDKEQCDKDWEKLCEQKKLDSEKMLQYDFDVIDSINRKEIAQAAICKWAERAKIIINTDQLFDKMLLVAGQKRSVSGFLTKSDIEKIIQDCRDVRIGFSLAIGKNDAEEVITRYENILREYPQSHNKLIGIKYAIENANYMDAEAMLQKMVAEGFLEDKLQEIQFWLLNMLERSKEVKEKISENKVYSDFAYFEISNAFYALGELDMAFEWLLKVEKNRWSQKAYSLCAKIFLGKNQKDKAKEIIEEYLAVDQGSASMWIMLGELSNPVKATECYRNALKYDKKCSVAYLGLAEISEKVYDFETAYDMYKMYIDLEKEKNINHVIYMKFFMFGFLCNKTEINNVLTKWNSTFRKQVNAKETIGIANIVIQENRTDLFVFESSEDGYRVFLNDKCICQCADNINKASTDVGLVAIEEDIQKIMSRHRNDINPLKQSREYAEQEAAVPYIRRTYDNLDVYSVTMDRLLQTGFLKEIVHYSDKIGVYTVDEIVVDFMIHDKELNGEISIGDISLNVWIGQTKDGLMDFNKKLNGTSFQNKAIIDIRCRENDCLTRLLIEKDRIQLKYI